MTRLYRSQRDKKIMGLCGGLGEAFHIDSTLLRLIFVAVAVFSGGSAIVIYLAASLVIPKEPVGYGPYGRPHPPGYGGGYGPPPGGSYDSPYGGGYGPHSDPRHAPPGGYGPAGYGSGPHYGNDSRGSGPRPGNPGGATGVGQTDSELDRMMKEIEKKAMAKELEELKAKLAKYEKGE